MLQPPTKFKVSVSTLVFFDFEPGARYCKLGNLPTNFGVYGTFRSRLMDQQLSDGLRDLAILTFNLGGHGA